VSSKLVIGKSPRTVALVTLGCARNETDSEELAGRLAADGWMLVDDPTKAEIAVINTCGFIESAKKDSIDALMQAHSLKGNGVTKAVVAVGCMAERYGNELASALPEADAILGFDDYQEISARLSTIIDGGKISAHTPKDRRTLLPIAPSQRAEQKAKQNLKDISPIGTVLRKRLDKAPIAPLKIASGCDRRCSFCAIPYFRGSFVSRTPNEIIEEAKWLADSGVSELYLVSENTTSYGKDFGDLKLMEKLLPELSKIEAVKRIRLSYLQPAEVRPSLLQAIGVFGYSDEDKTEGMSLANKVSPEVIGERVAELSTLVDELITQRAEARIGQMVTVLIEDEDEQEGRADHQGPDVDGSTFVKSRNKYRVGEYVQAVVSDVMGVDLIAQVI